MLCRLRVGHTRVTHEWILKGDRPPMCRHCLDPLTVRHILVECVSFSLLTSTIYPQTANMSEINALKHILGENNKTYDINPFLKQMGCYNEI